MESPVCRWGIMGCANIARKNARCMLLAENASVVAVVSCVGACAPPVPPLTPPAGRIP
jgi:predicted dehydrogenase